MGFGDFVLFYPLILYLKGMRRMMFQLSGFYSSCKRVLFKRCLEEPIVSIVVPFCDY